MSFTEEEIENAIKKLFMQYDTDQNGVLDRQELVKFLSEAFRNIGGKDSNLAEVDSLLKKYDANKDGVIDPS